MGIIYLCADGANARQDKTGLVDTQNLLHFVWRMKNDGYDDDDDDGVVEKRQKRRLNGRFKFAIFAYVCNSDLISMRYFLGKEIKLMFNSASVTSSCYLLSIDFYLL